MEFLPAWPLTFTAQTAFGLLLVAGVIGGHLAHRVPWLPSVTGFMLIGIAIGPSGFGFIGREALAMAHSVIDIALALILYRLGLSLNLRGIRDDLALPLISFLESAATFIAVFFLLKMLGVDQLIAALAAAIVISSSPAILIHVANEVGARGSVTERAKQMVALNNMFAFIAFSAVLPVGHLANQADWNTTWLQPLYQFGGSLLLGAATAVLLSLLTRFTQRTPQYRLALIIGALMFGLGMAAVLELSTLFVPLVTGVVARALERAKHISDVEFGEAFELFFIVLFVYAGAKIDLAQIGSTFLLALGLVLVRGVTKWLTVYTLSRGLDVPVTQATASGLLLVPMAGLAIGLAQTADALFALQAEQLNGLILASVAILETLGPPLAAYAFRLAGEARSPASQPD